MRQIVIFLLILSAIAGCTPNRETRTLTADVPAKDVSVLMTHVNIGAVVITTSQDGKAHVSVTLKPSNSFFWSIFTHSTSPEAIRAATVVHSLDNGTLDFSVQYPNNKGAEDIEEEWTIAVPVNVHIKSHINIGKLQVTGITGGVDAQLNIGKVTLDIPGGPLDVSVNVGKISAQTHTLRYGDVTLASNIGDTHLTVDGMSVGDSQKQGTGNSMAYHGKGTDVINLKANTGKVTLAMSEPAQSGAGGK